MNSRKKRRGSKYRGYNPFLPLSGQNIARAPFTSGYGMNGAKAMRNHHQDEAASGGDHPDYAELKKERDNYLDMARRERADFDNYRKRMQREMAQIKLESLSSFLKEFFGPLDDLDRVMQESAKSQSYESLATGVKIMEEKFWRVLAKAGITKINAQGKQFDPNQHEAMAAVPSADVPPNTIIEVYENGYKLDDVVLRPVRVVVSRAP